MTQTEPSPAFWRCPKCQTPNPAASYVTACIACGAARPRGIPVEIASPSTPARTAPGSPTLRRWLRVLTSVHAGVVLLVLAWTLLLGDLWWPATLLLLMPRALWLLPLLPLALMNLRVRRWPIGLAHLALALVIVGPLMGLHLPFGRLLSEEPRGTRLRVLTFNRGADRFDPGDLIDLIERERIDLIFFQEPADQTKPAFRHPTLRSYFDDRWYHNQTWSIVSRFPLAEDLGQYVGPDPDPNLGIFRPGKIDRVVVALPSGESFRAASAHFPTVRFGFDYLWKGQFSTVERFMVWRRGDVERLSALALEDAEVPVLLAGDFNTPYQSRLLDPIRSLFREGFESAGIGYGYTRPASFPWVGIDYVLATHDWTFTRCRVGPNLGSDHRPVLAELILSPPDSP